MRRRGAPTLVLLALLAACTHAADTPEAQIRAFLARGEQAVRERDAGALKAMIADDYRDDEGRDRRTLLGLASYHFLQPGSLHAATRLRTVSFPEHASAKAEVLVALGRTAIDLTSLPDVDAEVWVVSLDLRRGDDGWQLTRARWRRATVDDL